MYAVVTGLEAAAEFGLVRASTSVEVTITTDGAGTNVVARNDAQSEARCVLAGWSAVPVTCLAQVS